MARDDLRTSFYEFFVIFFDLLSLGRFRAPLAVVLRSRDASKKDTVGCEAEISCVFDPV